MTDIVLGLIAIIVGLIFCFAGSSLMRFVITLWGAFAGFGVGAGLVAQFTGDHFLGTVLGWIVGFVFALIFAAFAYLYYAVAVVIAMAGIGFAIGSSILVALGVTWNWLIVLAAVALAVVFALFAIAGNLPLVLLTVLSAVGGAAVAVSGLMLLFGAIDSDTFTSGGFVGLVRDDWWWYLLYLVLAIVGVITQSRNADAARENMRRQWESGAH